MTEFNAGDRVRLDYYADEFVNSTGVYRPYLATVLTSGVTEGCVHLEWDDAAGNVEDEFYADRLVLVDSQDDLLLRIAAEADQIIGGDAGFYVEMLINRFGDFTEMVSEYEADDDESPDEIEESLREGNLEVITDSIICELPKGYTLGRNDDGDLAILKG